jgi:AAA15 family ATPase/GTPase
MDNFISPSEIFNSERLVNEYNKAEDKLQEHQILDFLKIIDKTITDIRVNIQGGAHLRVKKGNEGVMPLTALGDAAKKVVRIALSVLNGDHKAIFVDEIENGIHYTAHREFWRLLFHIAETLDVQVFATTHSLEMIKAYHEVASAQNIKDVTYFELFRNGKTNEIQGRKLDMEKLEYKLERNLELRGE